LFYGVYDPRDGSLQFVNAGHLPPVIRRADGSFEHVGGAGTSGLALGMFERAEYDSHRIVIGKGDVLVLYSDGITEAEDASGNAFEEAGLERVLSEHGTASPDELGRAVLRAVARHARDARLGDDLTALVLRRSAAA
jgi:sigma-B regulation protein RsbU (phosphoserine phosphatase)